LRKRSVEYRNNLNIIRAWFLSRHAPKFDTFLEEKKQKEKQNKKETKFRWKYLPREPDQKFLTPGAEIRGVQLFIGIPSLIAGGFLFAITRFIIHSWDLRFGSEYAANYRLCFIVMLISIVATATTWYFIIALFKRYGKKDDDKNLLRDGQD
jgi:hypothetical protein